ncbi:putative tafazzin [Drepanopeziza brunnea f. sp. 'multigermtubi' MB_m1]|uniref:Tafazzin family protein n=1 Tax=Marssonina brunnea f. sp. multigermtubi (strain MB_m1) TaxID=1072389 RepID=K1XXP0_MARBU|nr:putative tafazzin [Drepanopeziza brunnea f. sp. 'multigermtubi' MB_m1]EKD17574.1 putative tafazzin [Drepanopeziza brunnea f. sp. 'multigermtubi' MB_m1]
MSSPNPLSPSSPSLPWRLNSSLIMGLTASLSRGFYYGLNYMEVTGLDRFLETLDRRRDSQIIMDDPLIWGVLPFRYGFNPSNHRWSLGSYDICFQGRLLTGFFNFGQVLPTHRGAHSPHGGLFQPVMTQAIRLLSSQPFAKPPLSHTSNPGMPDPFTTGSLTYTTNGEDSFTAPSVYLSRKHSWIHIFPEGRVHQHPKKSMRYFKWGISRLILESEPLPEIVPIFIDGNQEVMHESRGFPEFIPRAGKNIRIAFGESIDGEKVFGELRERWKKLVAMQKEALAQKGLETNWEMGELTEWLKYGTEAVALRKEVTMKVRMEVLKVRRSLGYPDEDPKQGRVETWIEEGDAKTKEKKDGSSLGDT